MEHNEFERIYELQKGGRWFGKGRNEIVIALLKIFLRNLRGKIWLDIGCSEGTFLDHLKREEVHFSAIDVDEMAIKFCNEKGHADKVKQGSATAIPFSDNMFDVVTALDVVEHIREDHQVIREMKRICKSGGTLFIIVPVHPWLWSSNDVAYHHVKRYTRAEVVRLVESEGLIIEKISYFMTLLFPAFVIATWYKKLFQSKMIASNVLRPVPKWLNSFLHAIMRWEKKLLKNYNLPFGSSLLVLARK